MHQLLLLSLLPFAAIAIPVTAPAGSCATVGIITARASTEAAGEGIIGSSATAIQSGSTQTVSRTSVDYPALLYPYVQSVQSGVAAMTAEWDLLHAPSNEYFLLDPITICQITTSGLPASASKGGQKSKC